MRLLAVTPFRSSLLSAPLSPSPVHCFKQTLTIAVRALFSSIRSDSPTPPPSLISDDDADKATITNNAGNVIHYKRATAYFPYSGSPAHSRILNKSSNSPPAPFTTSTSSKCKSTLVLASAPTLLSPAKLRTSTRKWKSEQTSISPPCSVYAPPHPHLLSRLLLPPSLAHAHGNTEQYLHVDSDYKPCLSLHHLVKALDKSFMFVDELLGKED
ncbi:hypothetical protein BJ165DRAFT_1530736 [Panaeolus papilionaceus]|nr:hypothetical protein BJ165DRAFT_1530736 [Panaeolus papilionaceus]